MKRVIGLAVAVIVTTSFLSAASAAPAPKARDAKLGKGLQNARKVSLAAQERDQKMREVRKQAYAKRQQALLRGNR